MASSASQVCSKQVTIKQNNTDMLIRKPFIHLLLILTVSMPSLAPARDGERHADRSADRPTDQRGTVLKVTGDVEVIDAKGVTRSVTEVDEPLNENDTVVTKKDSRVVLRFDDGTLSVLNEESRLRVENTSWYSYLGGKIYFTFKRVFGQQRRVKTPSATLGIRGTTFIIDGVASTEGEMVSLKEGLVSVESTGPAFEIHRKQEMNEFEAFRQQHQQAREKMHDEFEQYRQQTMKEFVEYRRQFTLKPGRSISLKGYRIDETEMSDQVKADFESFEAEAEDMIRAFRQTSSQ